jgi:NTE family protein
MDPRDPPGDPQVPAPRRDDLAIVLSGGGARAAYQTGALRGIAKHVPDLRFPVIAGVSAGAINATFLAGHPGSTREAVTELSSIWAGLQVEDILMADPPSLARDVMRWARWAARLAAGESLIGSELRGLFHTEPLRRTICRGTAAVDGELIGIERNLERGTLRAIAVTALNYMTGQTVTWVQGAGILPSTRSQRRHLHTRLTVEHVMASCSLPILFPAVRVASAWYGDGGVRLSAPLSPALRLGASRVLAISPHYQPSHEEADRPQIPGYPPIAQILSHLLDAIFLDLLDEDVRRLETMNELIVKIPPGERGNYRPIDILVLRPSVDLGRLAMSYEARLPETFRLLARSIGSDQATSSDFLSMLMFQPDYLVRLMDIGEADAEARMAEIRAFMAGGQSKTNAVDG